MDLVKEMRRANIPGLSIAYFDKTQSWTRNYGVLQQETAKRVTEQSLFHACSISKMVTAICVLRLVADKQLKLYEDVNHYLKSWRLTAKGNEPPVVTLAMLLAHYAGISDPNNSFVPYQAHETAVTAKKLLTGATRFCSEPIRVTAVPGSQFSYSDAGYCVIRQVVEETTGKTLDHFAQKYIFEPLLLPRAFFWHQGHEQEYPLAFCAAGHDTAGQKIKQLRACYPNPEGAGLWISAQELAAISQELIRCYHGKGRILPQADARRMLTPYLPGSYSGLGVFTLPSAGLFFSQGWGGGMQCKLIGIPEQERGLAVMMNCDPGVDQDQSIIGRIIEQICG